MNGKERPSRVHRATLWFGLFGGAIAWTLHLMLAYVVSEFGCVGRTVDYGYLGISLVAWLEAALTAGTTFIAAAATAVVCRSNRRLQLTEPQAGADTAAERYTAWAGVLTSGTFTFVILFESIPILYFLQSC